LAWPVSGAMDGRFGGAPFESAKGFGGFGNGRWEVLARVEIASRVIVMVQGRLGKTMKLWRTAGYQLR
jgi:hypothetical protein